MNNANKLSKDEIFVGLSLLLGLFLPHTSTFLLLVNPLLCILFYLKFSLKTNSVGILPYKILLLISLCLSFFFNANTDIITTKVILYFVYLCLLFFCFPLTSGVRIRNVFLYISVIIILFSQLVYVVRIYPAMAIIDTLYPMSDMYSNIYSYMDNITFSNITEFRLGGLFRNPNHLAKYVNLLTVLFVINNRNKYYPSKYIFYLIVLLSIILSGSRTGLVILLLLMIFEIISNNRFTKYQKLFIFIILGLLFMLFTLSDLDFRGLKVQEGISDSAGSKFEALMYYLSQDNSYLNLLFGNLNPDTFLASSGIINQLDSEYGYLIYQYGFVGFISYVLFWIAIFKRYPRNNRIIFFILLWTISSTIILAYRSAFVMLLAFSVYFNFEFDESNETSNNYSN